MKFDLVATCSNGVLITKFLARKVSTETGESSSEWKIQGKKKEQEGQKENIWVNWPCGMKKEKHPNYSETLFGDDEAWSPSLSGTAHNNNNITIT